MQIGVISNPHSGRNRQMLGYIHNMLKQHHNVTHIVTDSAAALPEAMRLFASQSIDTVAINGGDGSVACALEHLPLFGDRQPLLIALPGGTTNVTVNDIGVRGRLDQAVLAMLRWLHQGHPHALEVERDILAVRRSDGSSGGCGLVFGVGAVVHGIEYWNEQVRARGMRSELSSGLAMLRTLWGMFSGHERFGKSLSVRVRDPALNRDIDADFMLLTVCTLRRLFLGITPFWGTELAPLECMAIERDAPQFLRNLPAILRGQRNARLRPEYGYHSFNSHRLELDFHGSYTLDGELRQVAESAAPLTLYSPGSARFLRIH